VSIYYGTAPEKLDELKEAVFAEIKKFAQNGPSEDELKKAQEKMLREREIALRENGFWLNMLSSTYFIKDGDFSGFGKYNNTVQGLTTESVKKAFQKYFNFENYISVALKPAD
jgi:zinc protease